LGAVRFPGIFFYVTRKVDFVPEGQNYIARASARGNVSQQPCRDTRNFCRPYRAKSSLVFYPALKHEAICFSPYRG